MDGKTQCKRADQRNLLPETISATVTEKGGDSAQDSDHGTLKFQATGNGECKRDRVSPRLGHPKQCIASKVSSTTLEKKDGSHEA